jgi:tRNA modification GTPase
MNLNDTIVACATPAGYSSIAVIRLSGRQAISLIQKIFVHKDSVNDVQPNRALYGKIIHPHNNCIIDTVLTTFFLKPHSYTGEDVVEISCHGNPLIIDQIVRLLIHCGARVAQRGEFTKRALLNGKIDLLQAEAVLDTVYAPCDEAKRLAIEQYEGKLSSKIYELRSKIVDILTLVEAHIDFPEEEDVNYDSHYVIEKIEGMITEIDYLLKNAEIGVKLKEGYKTLIMGRTNVGKSTLFNKLVGYDRTIIHDKPGTTRDYIEERVEIAGLYFRLFDTAGFYLHAHGPDEIARDRSKALIDQADLILLMFDGSEPMNEEDIYLYNHTKEKKNILIVNKIDLNLQLDNRAILSDSIKISAKTGQHLDMLKDAIKNILVPQRDSQNILLTRQRHIQALEKVKQFLKNTREAPSLEATAFEIHCALDTIGELTGTVATSEILNRIFDEFCVGK